MKVFGDRQVLNITNTKLWLRIVWENAHLNDRALILAESRRVVRELDEEEEGLRQIIVLFRSEGIPVPSNWFRVICPNTLTATSARLRFSERRLRLSPGGLIREVS